MPPAAPAVVAVPVAVDEGRRQDANDDLEAIPAVWPRESPASEDVARVDIGRVAGAGAGPSPAELQVHVVARLFSARGTQTASTAISAMAFSTSSRHARRERQGQKEGWARCLRGVRRACCLGRVVHATGRREEQKTGARRPPNDHVELLRVDSFCLPGLCSKNRGVPMSDWAGTSDSICAQTNDSTCLMTSASTHHGQLQGSTLMHVQHDRCQPTVQHFHWQSRCAGSQGGDMQGRTYCHQRPPSPASCAPRRAL